MALPNPYANYQDNKIFTSSKEELTLMLYEGAIKFCNQAKLAIKAKDMVQAHKLITRVEDIIEELQSTLNHSIPVSKNMASLYDYMFRRLVDANIEKNVDILEEVCEFLRDFRDMWKEAMKLAKIKA